MPLPRRLHHTTPALGGVGAFRLPCYASSRSGPNSRVSERARVERFLGDRPAMQDAHRCMVQMDSARTERYHTADRVVPVAPTQLLRRRQQQQH